jgi:hypothetical protein
MSEEDALFRVVRGTLTPEELAALVGAIVTRSRPAAPTPPPTVPAWVRSARPGTVSASGMPVPGVDAWRISTLPR